MVKKIFSVVLSLSIIGISNPHVYAQTFSIRNSCEEKKLYYGYLTYYNDGALIEDGEWNM